jgi:hypothetical protein
MNLVRLNSKTKQRIFSLCWSLNNGDWHQFSNLIEKQVMEEKSPLQDKDRNPNIPSEANSEKHVNLLDIEEKDIPIQQKTTDWEKGDKEEGQREWQQGIEDEDKALKNENL